MVAEAARLVLTWLAYVGLLTAALYVVAWPLASVVARRRGAGRRAYGWRPWVVWLLAVVGVVAAAGPLMADVNRRARVAKARGDVLLLGKAVAAYTAHCGGPPAVDAADGRCPVATSAARGAVPKALITAQRNARGAEAGPFATYVPRLPAGWTGAAGVYAYMVDDRGRARVCASGDGAVADSLGAGRCPR